MTINATYIATVLNSMIRMTSPILLAALTAAICNKVKVFNIGMEGTMMAGAFFSIVATIIHTVFFLLFWQVLPVVLLFLLLMPFALSVLRRQQQ